MFKNALHQEPNGQKFLQNNTGDLLFINWENIALQPGLKKNFEKILQHFHTNYLL